MPFDAPHGVNVAECLALAEFLDGLPLEQFDMSQWGFSHRCRTVACVAGWQVIRKGGQINEVVASEVAATDLSITESKARELFEPRDADGFIISYSASQAAAVLRHLAATGNVDWSVAEGVA